MANQRNRNKAPDAAMSVPASERVHAAIDVLQSTGKPISFAAVARIAGVSRQTIYNVESLRSRVEAGRADAAQPIRPPAVVTPASDASLRVRLEMALDDNKRLREENAALRQQLAKRLGDERRIGRG